MRFIQTITRKNIYSYTVILVLLGCRDNMWWTLIYIKVLIEQCHVTFGYFRLEMALFLHLHFDMGTSNSAPRMRTSAKSTHHQYIQTENYPIRFNLHSRVARYGTRVDIWRSMQTSVVFKESCLYLWKCGRIEGPVAVDIVYIMPLLPFMTQIYVAANENTNLIKPTARYTPLCSLKSLVFRLSEAHY